MVLALFGDHGDVSLFTKSMGEIECTICSLVERFQTAAYQGKLANEQTRQKNSIKF